MRLGAALTNFWDQADVVPKALAEVFVRNHLTKKKKSNIIWVSGTFRRKKRMKNLMEIGSVREAKDLEKALIWAAY